MQWSGVGNHARYLRVVAVGNKQGPAQLPLGLWLLRRQDVPRLRLAPLDFAGASLAEALGRARMGLQLRHSFSSFPGFGGAGCSSGASEGRDFPARLGLNQYNVSLDLARAGR